MENLENVYIKSLLSKVAYENGIDVGYNFNFLGAEFSNAEREYLNENYEVIGTKHTESGLDLVIFTNLVTGENTISIAGTDIYSAVDWGNDLSLGATGIAHKQFIELYNYYQQITHAYGENILQITKLENPSYEPEKPYLRIETAENEYTYYLLESVENNELPIDEFVAINANNLSFTGHSLGGHLAGIMSIITGKEATIFNAPSYKENTILSSGCEYVKTDGSIEETTSDFDALICKLLNISNPDSKEGNITHYQNNYGGGFSENIAGSWNSTEEIYCLNGNTNWVDEHSINEIHSTLYAYYVIKDITNGAESFFNNSNLTSPNETFENVYKAYCLNKGEIYQELDYSEYANINQIISDINEWSEIQKANGGAIKVDSFNHSASLITGTDGADIIYTGGGNDTVNTGKGNDIVYGINLNGDAEAATTSTKTVNLGSGNDTYYGSEAKDIVTTTGANTENDTNHIYLGSGSDTFTGGNGVDIVDGGVTEDVETDTNTIHLGGGADEYKGGMGDDIVYGGDDNDIIRGGNGENKLYGENGDDKITGGVDADIISGGNGNDIIYGYGGNNELNGDAGNDYIYGGDNADTIHGGDGDDYIRGYNGDNKLYGDAGNDNIYGQNGNDELYGGTGTDYLSPGIGNNFIDCGVDNHIDMVRINNDANGVDTIVNATGSDYILCAGGFNMSTFEQVGNDIIIYGNRGNKIIIKDIKLPEEDEPEDPENPGNPSSIPFENVPLLYLPDGSVLKWNGTQYVDSGKTLPSYEDMIDHSDVPDSGNLPTEGDIPENANNPEANYGETIETIFTKIQTTPSENITSPEDGATKTQADKEVKFPQYLIDDINTFWASAKNAKSPLVLDLDNNGIETISTDGGVYFDHDNNQKYENTGWIGKNDAFLVRDLNNNGQIDNGTEMFGNHTIKSDGSTAYNGFEALADLDSNNNGKFDSGDEAWNEVKVWRDYNTNGIVETGEILTLEQAGVESINLKYNYQTETDSNGNTEIQQGTYTKTDGTTGKISDVWFEIAA